MTRQRCREVFSAAVGRPDTGVLIDAPEGGNCPACQSVGKGTSRTADVENFNNLSQWLDLPRLGLVHARQLQACRAARLPTELDGLLIDGVDNLQQAMTLQTELESLWRVPVLGYLQLPSSLRTFIESWPAETPPATEVLTALADHLSPHWDERQLGELMQKPNLPQQFEVAKPLPPFGPQVQIAIAQDEAFGLCFPEVLDALERSGATLTDFSPLRSERLPAKTDLVYIGCGHPERYAEELARNHCLMQSFRSFAAAGGRIYAEGSGSAYLCRQLILPGGSAAMMAGIIPANARFTAGPATPQPTEVTFGLGCWLADRKTTLRGYRDPNWQLEPCGAMMTYSGDPAQRCDILGRSNAICSRILFNLAAHPSLLERFVRPSLPVGNAVRSAR
ncbi:Cobyrinic acid A,C-diamide synthase [Anatilimnocola aggregata]|uniref:Cobyrinic acid A,C-diamide synthase n=2 Tax=Anatilimnocola aggregata TaxID=2528021 RepID=A0A517Y880_9BACT|nr:Cobyrinic acid A,C-diamide synthase [Anatilimnocola aggregata]